MPVRTNIGVAPSGSDIGWMRGAACLGLDVDVFFVPTHARGAPKRRAEAEAKAVCGECAAITECAAFAAAARIPYGVWGGQTEQERGYSGGRHPSAARFAE